MEKILVGFKVNGAYDLIRCTSIERYGDNYAFSTEDGELIRKDDKILEVPINDVLQITAKKK